MGGGAGMKLRLSDWEIRFAISERTDRSHYLELDYCRFTPALILIAFMCGGRISHRFWDFRFEREDQLLHFIWLTGVTGEIGYLPF